MDVLAEKAKLRERAKAARAAARARHGDDADRALTAAGCAAIAAGQLPVVAVVSGFLPIGEEIDPRPLMAEFARRGARIALPVMIAKAQPLQFRAWREGDAMVERAWGIREPGPDAEVVVPQLLIVPLLAVDRAGWRLGYGGGFYDRTLRRLRAGPGGRAMVTAVGVGFCEQVVDAVAHSDYDEPLDLILTPSGIARLG